MDPSIGGGDVKKEGICTFLPFGGADLMGSIRFAGFALVQAGKEHDVFAGDLSNNYRYGDDSVVLSIVFRAYEARSSNP